MKLALHTIQQFCSTDIGREILHHPFAFEGEGKTYVCATDGRILLFVDHAHAPCITAEDQTAGKMPSVRELFSTARNFSEAHVPLPPADILPPPAEIDCNHCGGTGRLQRRTVCDICNGYGECPHCGEPCSRCDDGYLYERDDTGTGEPCERCDGSGKVPGPGSAVRLQNPNHPCSALLSDHHLRLLHLLPGVRLALTCDSYMFVFQFEGGFGAAMPRRPTKDLHVVTHNDSETTQ